MTDGKPRPLDAPESSGSLFGGLSDEELLRIRVRPAQYAKLIGCSKQTVSRWVKSGVIVLSLDGTIDPQQATRALLTRGDPRRLRSRVLRSAAEELQELRVKAARVPTLEGDLAAVRAEVVALRTERDDLAARVADAEGAGDVMAERAFDLAEAIHTVLPLLTELPAAADALRAALAAGDAE